MLECSVPKSLGRMHQCKTFPQQGAGQSQLRLVAESGLQPFENKHIHMASLDPDTVDTEPQRTKPQQQQQQQEKEPTPAVQKPEEQKPVVKKPAVQEPAKVIEKPKPIENPKTIVKPKPIEKPKPVEQKPVRLFILHITRCHAISQHVI
jgi:hypothetical protein